MLQRIIQSISEATPLGEWFGVTVVVVASFAVAWLVGHFSARVAAAYVDRTERRRLKASGVDTGVMMSLRQRETAISLLHTTAKYVAYLVAIVVSVIAVSGGQRLQTIVGASLLALVIGFSAQRVLMDVIAGLLMFFEGWFRIGDTVVIDAWDLQGVVEEASLRSMTIRSVNGDLVHVTNSQISSLRVIPRGYRDVDVEFFVRDLEAGRALVGELARLTPVGPTRFVRRPRLVESETLAQDLHRIHARCSVAVGREWLVEEFLPAVLKERAGPALLVHGPVITYSDEPAVRSFARRIRTDEDAAA